jgi:hypothetical protein
LVVVVLLLLMLVVVTGIRGSLRGCGVTDGNDVCGDEGTAVFLFFQIRTRGFKSFWHFGVEQESRRECAGPSLSLCKGARRVRLCVR